MGDIVAAIDLGTSRTAYSYIVLDKEDTGNPQVHLGETAVKVKSYSLQ